MKKNIVGVALRFYTVDDKIQYGIYKRYLDYLNMENLIPLLLTPENYLDLLPHCQGILLPGGGDINPSYYSQDANNVVFDDKLDKFEFNLITKALKENLAIFGICRGLQVLNVYFKGTLNQHILSHQNTNHSLNCFDVLIYSKASIIVNSYHHQSIKDLASNFTTFLKSEDQTIEGIIDKKRRILAVQYHPEINKDRELLKYFKSLVNERLI